MKRPDHIRQRLLLCIAAVQLGCGVEAFDRVRPTTGEDANAAQSTEIADANDNELPGVPVEPADPIDVASRGADALTRLAALQVFEAGHISDPNPSEGPHCYNLPCTEEEMVSQVERLEVLVDVVAAVVEAGPLALTQATSAAASEGNCEPLNLDIESSLASLQALHVVNVGGLSGGDASHCYCFSGGDPCVDAVAEKAGLLARVVADASSVPSSPFAASE